MPLNPRKTKEAASENISTLRHEGYPQDQAVAIGLKKAGLSKSDRKKSRRSKKRK